MPRKQRARTRRTSASAHGTCGNFLALTTLGKLDAASLAQHGAAIREELAKWGSEERGEALKILRML